MTILPVAESLSLPGFVNAHCHAFQRALRGRGGGADFWEWRELMLGEAERQTPTLVRREYVEVYRELRRAGYRAVGEFHYLGFDEALAAVDAAEEAGIGIVLLLAAYGRSGLDRFRQDSVVEYLLQVDDLRGRGIRVGLAPHSVRACPAGWLAEIGRYAAAERLPLHVHADEQPREIEECLAEHGVRPIELLDRTGCLSERTTVVHATHANGDELDLLARAGARICACPTTEANLGDGFLPVERVCTRGIGICIGSDSNVRIDPLEELRELETTARRMTGRREVCNAETLLCFGADEGAAALGLDSWPDIEIDLEHRSLRGLARSDVLDALVLGCGADVVAGYRMRTRAAPGRKPVFSAWTKTKPFAFGLRRKTNLPRVFVLRHLVTTPGPKARTRAPATGRAPAFTVTVRRRTRSALSLPLTLNISFCVVWTPLPVPVVLRVKECGRVKSPTFESSSTAATFHQNVPPWEYSGWVSGEA